MPRSEESKARRLAYTRQWQASPRGRDYHAQWRSEHREKENARTREWKRYHRDVIRAQRQRYYSTHQRSSVPDPIPAKFIGHPFFDTARFICGEQPYWDTHLSWEEAMGEAVLALIEGRDPEAAVKESWLRETSWRFMAIPFYPNVDVRHDHKIIFVSVHD